LSLPLLLQELQNERERNTVLQRQLQEQARSMQEATSKASTLSDDNQKLKDAVERLSKSATDKTDETVRYMQEAGELRKANITLEAAAQQAKDEKASAERKLQALERVSA
jgi:chromosome segregation ATPase